MMRRTAVVLLTALLAWLAATSTAQAHERLTAVRGADRAGQRDVTDAQHAHPVGDGDGVHLGPGGELRGEALQHLLGARVADVLQLGDRAAAVVVAHHAGEGDDRAGRRVGDGVLVLGDGQRRVDDARDQRGRSAHGAEATPRAVAR